MCSMKAASPKKEKVLVFLLASDALTSGHGPSWLSYLGPAEQEKAAQFHRRQDALTYTTQQALMRCLAAQALGLGARAAAQLRVDRRCLLCSSKNLHGKPRIQGINFNMSRSYDRAAGALLAQGTQASELELGVDIERNRGSFFAGFDTVALTEAERDLLTRLAPPQAQQLRLMLWTAKEAVLKASGHGLALDPQRVALDLGQLSCPPDTVSAFRGQAKLSLTSEEPRNFYLYWQKEADYMLALASSEPVDFFYYPVHYPGEIAQILSQS